jgi:spermidine/putrescine transport system permease protein
MPVAILGHILVTQPFVILVVTARLARFDDSAVLAARDLGATRWQAFRLVALPQIGPALVGAGLIAAALSLDDFIIASFTIGGGNTISTFVWGKLRTTLDSSINAIATILLLLTVGVSATRRSTSQPATRAASSRCSLLRISHIAWQRPTSHTRRLIACFAVTGPLS